jgi:hypothetical protein
MANAKGIRTEYGHGAGKAGGRWMPRADAKAYAKKKRRAADARLTTDKE